jgi:hypothetical protein
MLGKPFNLQGPCGCVPRWPAPAVTKSDITNSEIATVCDQRLGFEGHMAWAQAMP